MIGHSSAVQTILVPGAVVALTAYWTTTRTWAAGLAAHGYAHPDFHEVPRCG